MMVYQCVVGGGVVVLYYIEYVSWDFGFQCQFVQMIGGQW